MPNPCILSSIAAVTSPWHPPSKTPNFPLLLMLAKDIIIARVSGRKFLLKNKIIKIFECKLINK